MDIGEAPSFRTKNKEKKNTPKTNKKKEKELDRIEESNDTKAVQSASGRRVASWKKNRSIINKNPLNETK